MSHSAWYIGCAKEDVGEAALLTGDRGRIDRIAKYLDRARILPENRGLRTVTGMRAGKRVTATAFGMGGPIAAIVLHELHHLGVKSFVRIGTAMAMPPARLGELLLADGAYSRDGTSRTYAPAGYPAVADFDLGAALREAMKTRSLPWRAGLFGTYDGFYTESFALGDGETRGIHKAREDAKRLRLIATDMETATLLTAGRVLGARVASLCLATVDGLAQEKLDAETLAAREAEMFEAALDAVAAPEFLEVRSVLKT